jgi:hypothetical protein
MVTQVIGTAAAATSGFSAYGAKSLGSDGRKDLAIQVLARTAAVTELADRHKVSRKFLYEQARRASAALDDRFNPTEKEEEVLFHLPVTKGWIRQFVLGLALEGHSSFRGIGQLAQDLLDYPLSVGTIHNILEAAASQARVINQAQDLLGIRVGAHDEIYQAGRPVLVGLDAKSTYCYLLAEEDHCDETTWGVHLLDLADQGLHPDRTVADGGLALRAGQAAAWKDVPCHGDVFHGERDLGNLAFYLERRACGCTSARQKLEHQMQRRKQKGRGNELSKKLAIARQAETQAVALAQDVRVLADWLQKDILSLSGPSLATRRELFNFVVAELAAREGLCSHRIGPVRRTLDSGTTCWDSPRCWKKNSRTCPSSSRCRSPWFSSFANRKPSMPPARPTGDSVDLWWPGWAPSSNPCNRPCGARWKTSLAPVRWWRISTAACGPTSSCVGIWELDTWTCCGSS